jgi:hypothetical protein
MLCNFEQRPRASDGIVSSMLVSLDDGGLESPHDLDNAAQSAGVLATSIFASSSCGRRSEPDSAA